LLAFVRRWQANCEAASAQDRGPTRQSIQAIESWVLVAKPLAIRVLTDAQAVVTRLWPVDGDLADELGEPPLLYLYLKR
jgi:hypothetical protein